MLQDKDKRYAHEMRQHKAVGFASEPRTSRGRSLEIGVLAVVMLLIFALFFSVISKYVDEADEITREGTERNLLVTTRCVLIMQDPTDRELKAFEEKYKEWQPLSALLNGESELEKNVVETTQFTQLGKFFVRMSFEGRELISVEVAEKKQIKD